MTRVAITLRYKKSLTKLHPNVKKAAKKALLTLAKNPESRGLNLERLGDQVYSIRATLNYRILLRKKAFDSGPCFFAEDIAKHDIYKRQ